MRGSVGFAVPVPDLFWLFFLKKRGAWPDYPTPLKKSRLGPRQSSAYHCYPTAPPPMQREIHKYSERFRPRPRTSCVSPEYRGVADCKKIRGEREDIG